MAPFNVSKPNTHSAGKAKATDHHGPSSDAGASTVASAPEGNPNPRGITLPTKVTQEVEVPSSSPTSDTNINRHGPAHNTRSRQAAASLVVSDPPTTPNSKRTYSGSPSPSTARGSPDPPSQPDPKSANAPSDVSSSVVYSDDTEFRLHAPQGRAPSLVDLKHFKAGWDELDAMSGSRASTYISENGSDPQHPPSTRDTRRRFHSGGAMPEDSLRVRQLKRNIQEAATLKYEMKERMLKEELRCVLLEKREEADAIRRSTSGLGDRGEGVKGDLVETGEGSSHDGQKRNK